MGFAGLLAITTVIGGTMAAFQTRTKVPGVSVITTKNLNIGIFCGESEVEDNYCTQSSRCMPGSVIDVGYPTGLVIKNKNNVATGYDAYVRVRIYKTWRDEERKATSLVDSRISQTNNNNEDVLLSGWNNEWIRYDDDDYITLYYKKILKPEEYTSPFFKEIVFSKELNKLFAGKNVEIKIEADAVQALQNNNVANINNRKDINIAAILSAWNMEATLTEQYEIDIIKKKSNS